MTYNRYSNPDRLVSKTQKFLSDYRVKARITERRTQSYNTLSYDLRRSPMAFTDQYATTQYDPILELELSEADLTRLVDDVQSYRELLMQYGNNIGPYLNNAHAYAAQISYEHNIRANNPGVKLAWEKYQLMLKIAGGE